MNIISNQKQLLGSQYPHIYRLLIQSLNQVRLQDFGGPIQVGPWKETDIQFIPVKLVGNPKITLGTIKGKEENSLSVLRDFKMMVSIFTEDRS